jgi:hypothetical protein
MGHDFQSVRDHDCPSAKDVEAGHRDAVARQLGADLAGPVDLGQDVAGRAGLDYKDAVVARLVVVRRDEEAGRAAPWDAALAAELAEERLRVARVA